jgi:signal peptidase I
MLLNLAIAAVVLVWAIDTFGVQVWRLRKVEAMAESKDERTLGEAAELLADSPLSQIMGKAISAVLVAYLAGVLLLRLDVDFALALVLATLCTGLFWLLDMTFLRLLRRRAVQRLQGSLEKGLVNFAVHETQPLLVEYSASFFPVLLAVLLLRSFLVEPFTIPSGSMLPTLEVGDYILVNKFDYGLRLPVLGSKIMPVGEPQRGDVIVFRYPVHPETNFIKRLVGLPGDHVVVDGEKVTINGKPLPETLDHPDPEVNPWQLYFSEQLGQHTHLVRQLVGVEGNDPRMQFVDVIVPPGEYFMMGDNRNESDDSRYWGFVPDRNIVGKAVYIWVHKKPGLNLPSFNRNGKVQ